MGRVTRGSPDAAESSSSSDTQTAGSLEASSSACYESSPAAHPYTHCPPRGDSQAASQSATQAPQPRVGEEEKRRQRNAQSCGRRQPCGVVENVPRMGRSVVLSKGYRRGRWGPTIRRQRAHQMSFPVEKEKKKDHPDFF